MSATPSGLWAIAHCNRSMVLSIHANSLHTGWIYNVVLYVIFDGIPFIVFISSVLVHIKDVPAMILQKLL